LTDRSDHRPRKQIIRGIAKGLVNMIMPIVTKPNIIGKENIPAHGPLLVVCNHFHIVDPVIVVGALPWPPEFLGDAEMPNTPRIARIFPNLYAPYRISPNKPNYESLKAGERILNQGGVLGIFPEGTPKPGRLRPAQPGAALLALRTGAPILPMSLISEDDWDVFGVPWREQRRICFTMRIGKVFGPLVCENTHRPSHRDLQEAQSRIIEEIGALLPSAYGGALSVNQI
jgi:1-acyl-sn-glycerol-3-phosphate acyltransferase